MKHPISHCVVLCGLFAALFMLAGCGEPPPPPRGVLELKSVPAGASVSIRDRVFGMTPCRLKAAPGSYLVRFSLAGHEDVWRQVEVVKGRTATVGCDLPSLVSSVLVVSRPAGARVEVGGAFRGMTPVVLADLKPGNYTATLKRSGHAPRVVTWNVKDDRPQEVIVTLDSNVGKLAIDSEPNHVPVYLDGKLRGITPYQAELGEGVYKLELRRSGYAAVHENVRVERDRRNALRFRMAELPGKLHVTTAPSGADVYINGQLRGRSPLALALAPGHYKLGIQASGYERNESSVNVGPGVDTKVDVQLNRNVGGIDLVAMPAGATVYFNGRRHAVVAPGENDLTTKVIRFRDLQPGKYRIMIAHKRAVPDRKSVTVEVFRGQISRPRPVELWVANAQLTLKDGRTETGVLYAENPGSVLFGPEPGIRIEYARRDIEKLVWLQAAE